MLLFQIEHLSHKDKYSLTGPMPRINKLVYDHIHIHNDTYIK